LKILLTNPKVKVSIKFRATNKFAIIFGQKNHQNWCNAQSCHWGYAMPGMLKPFRLNRFCAILSLWILNKDTLKKKERNWHW